MDENENTVEYFVSLTIRTRSFFGRSQFEGSYNDIVKASGTSTRKNIFDYVSKTLIFPELEKLIGFGTKLTETDIYVMNWSCEKNEF